jgi:hypothetical protein
VEELWQDKKLMERLGCQIIHIKWKCLKKKSSYISVEAHTLRRSNAVFVSEPVIYRRGIEIPMSIENYVASVED